MSSDESSNLKGKKPYVDGNCNEEPEDNERYHINLRTLISTAINEDVWKSDVRSTLDTSAAATHVIRPRRHCPMFSSIDKPVRIRQSTSCEVGMRKL